MRFVSQYSLGRAWPAVAAIILALCALAQSPANAQQPGRSVISRETIVNVLALPGLNPEQRSAALASLVAAVNSNGVDFALTPVIEQELRTAGASEELLSAVRANYRPQAATQTPAPSASPQAQQRPAERDPAMMDDRPVVTRHEIRVGGRTLRYTVTTGMMPLKNAAGETEARIFFMAYHAE
ncbi:MAG TPA: hypothetical protein VF754_02470, partial [Pyrinomonadaceae bacterium]